MFQATDPSRGPFRSYSKSGMFRHAVFSELQIPSEGFCGKILILNPLHQLGIIVNPLAAGRDFAVTLRRDKIGGFGYLIVGLFGHVIK